MRPREVAYGVPVADSRPAAAEAEAWLKERGYERGGGGLKLDRDASPPALPKNPDITIYELGEDEADGEGMSAIAAEALGLPITAETLFFSLPQEDHWRCYTAAPATGEGIVSTGSMLIHDGVAQFGLDVTVELVRGDGCTQALLRQRILDAAETARLIPFIAPRDIRPLPLDA